MRERWLRIWRSQVLIVAFVILDILVLFVAWAMMRHNVATPSSSSVGQPDPSTTPVASSSITGPLLLAVSPNGAVFRATRGSCDSRKPETARVWVASDKDKPLASTEIAGLQEVLGVVATDSALSVVGSTASCATKGFVSKDGGATWTEGPIPKGVWYLDTDRTKPTVHGPSGSVALNCTPESVTTTADPQKAYVTCTGAAIEVTATTKSQPLTFVVPGATYAVSSKGDFPFVLGATADCPAQLVQVNAGQKAKVVACLSTDSAGIGLARRGPVIYAQVGQKLVTVPDFGKGTVTEYPTS